MRFAVLLFAVFTVAVASLFAQPPGSEHPGTWEQRVASVLDSGEVVDRLYYLYLPQNYEQYPDRPLIINLHGSIDFALLDSAGQRPEVFMFGRQITPDYLDTTRASMMWKVAEAEHVLVACPLSKSPLAWSPFDPTGNLEYINAIIDDLEANYGDYIDSDRIYATGFSGGAGQTHRLGYYGGSRLAAIAPLYYPMNTSLYPLPPPPDGPLGILFVANKYDPTPGVPYTEPSDSTTILQTAAKWAEWMNMSYAGRTFSIGPVDTVLQIRARYYPGAGDSYCFMDFYTLFESTGQYRHSYPKFVLHGFQANVEVWNFVSRFHLPASRSREAALNAHRTITPARMQLGLMSVYPNPFNTATMLSFTLQQPSEVMVSVFDVLGREVMQLANGERFAAGTHSICVNAASLTSGIYFVRTDVDGGTQTQKIVLMK